MAQAKKQRRAFLSAGHSTTPGRDMGAVSPDGRNIEGILAAEFRALVFNELLSKYNYRASIDSNDSVTSQTINLFRKWATAKCLLIDIHFNSAANRLAQGVETIVPKNATNFEIALAERLSLAVATRTGFPLRGSYKGFSGVKDETQTHHKSLAWMRLTGENVLMEICFVSNQQEMSTWHKVKLDVAKAVADVIFEFVNK